MRRRGRCALVLNISARWRSESIGKRRKRTLWKWWVHGTREEADQVEDEAGDRQVLHAAGDQFVVGCSVADRGRPEPPVL
nr:hypothetical protein Iba_scaffold4346CG0280 [Ipomoea batatas]GME06844.1 hypothetical protein Iba_scaffold5164CG0020 [Ipomoea batatas]